MMKLIKMSWRLWIFCIVFFALSQCKEETQVQRDINNQHVQIMEIHDEVMPLMKDIYQLKKELANVSTDTSASTLVEELNKADEAMMDWMAQYDKPQETDADHQIYLSKQLESISTVKEIMLTSIENAKKYLQ